MVEAAGFEPASASNYTSAATIIPIFIKTHRKRANQMCVRLVFSFNLVYGDQPTLDEVMLIILSFMTVRLKDAA